MSSPGFIHTTKSKTLFESQLSAAHTNFMLFPEIPANVPDKTFMNKVAIGIDLGGTNTKGLIMNRQGQGRHITRIPTKADQGGNQILRNILDLIEILINKEGSKKDIIGIGIGSPGFIDNSGKILGGAENLPGWKGIQLCKPIQEQFQLPVIATNDVTLAAFAESKYGAGRNIRNMVCFTLGTGIGGGIVIDRKLYKGSNGMAGELGHLVVKTDGIPCNCGQRGCVEQYASASAMVKMARMISAELKKKKETPFTIFVNENPFKVTSKILYDYVKAGDPVAVQVHESACHMLARAIGLTVNALAPDRVILGGGVMKAGPIILDTTARYVPQYCWPDIWAKCGLVIAELGEDAGMLGAATMIFEEKGNDENGTGKN